MFNQTPLEGVTTPIYDFIKGPPEGPAPKGAWPRQRRPCPEDCRAPMKECGLSGSVTLRDLGPWMLR